MPSSPPLKSATPPITPAHPHPPRTKQGRLLTHAPTNGRRRPEPRTSQPARPAPVPASLGGLLALLLLQAAILGRREDVPPAPCILPSLLGFTMTMMVGDVRCGGEWPLVRRCRNGLVTLQPLTRHLGNIRRPQVSLPGCLASTSRPYNLTFGGKVNCWAFLGVVDFWA